MFLELEVGSASSFFREAFNREGREVRDQVPHVERFFARDARSNLPATGESVFWSASLNAVIRS